MQLVSFSVTNYRSITAANKLPIKQTTILIGPNNEGKSNILRALVTSLEVLRFFAGSKLAGGRLRSGYFDIQEAYQWGRDFPISLQEKKPDGESSFNLEFRLAASEVSEFEAEVKSNLNGTLPIQLTLGKKAPGFKVLKKGPGGQALSKKAEAIAHFVAKRININYIPAVRTAEAAEEIVARMVEKELRVAEKDAAYQQALAEVAKLQGPILERMSGAIGETLKQFLPNVKNVKVSIPSDARYRAMRRSYEVVVDDGTPTDLSRKGDGVQSLAALSLMRQTSSYSVSGSRLILAIEEPESHLHPNAIHQLRNVLGEIAQQNQVIMTTHCPSFVDRTSVPSNVIVHSNKAVPAKRIKDIRDILGVRASDNLLHAEVILLVEGDDDRQSLRSLLAKKSTLLATAISNGALGIDSLGGGTNLSYKLSAVREALCLAHCFLDDDHCGRRAYERALNDGLITPADVHFATCDGLTEAEIEDLYDVPLYQQMVQNKYGVSLQSPKFSGKQKWSNRMQSTFKHQGKKWDDKVEMAVKADIAELVETSSSLPINTHKTGPIDSLVLALETKLKTISHGKK